MRYTRFRAGQPNHADRVPLCFIEALLHRQHRLGDTFDVGKHLLAELREAVAGRVSPHELAADLAFERGQPALHGRLAELQRAPGREGAPVFGDSQKIPEIVPIEHARVMHLCVLRKQSCDLCRAGSSTYDPWPID